MTRTGLIIRNVPHEGMGLDPRFEHRVDQRPEALAEVGRSQAAMRADHA